MVRALVLAIVSLLAILPVQNGYAAFPERSIRLVVAFPPGGSIDVVARILAEKLRAGLGQTIVVENRAGAAGNIGAQSVASAAPDGYTVLMTTSAIAISPWMSPTSLDPGKDLVAVTRIALSPYVLVVRPSLPVKTLDEFIALAKAEPGKLTCSTYGVGSPPHLALELFKRAAGIDVVHAPYRGFGQALPDLIGGLLSCSVETPANIEQHVRAGTVRPVAVTSPAALEMFPGAAPLSALYPDVIVEGWQGIFLPAGTPQAVVERINAEFVKAVRDPDVVKRLRELGFDPVGDSSEQATAVFKRDYERFGTVIRELKLKAE
ncbi:MAG: tripartite tricarboxylate transporter substrate binding protein [bacterium]|nr:tripartite tricarboxylate transporter substrate binding protein [bacterium]